MAALAAVLVAMPAAAQKPAKASPAQPTSGVDVLRRMHERYAGKWYKSLTFVQKTTRRLPTGEQRVETWYEAGAIPGRLRIDVAPIDSGNAFMYVGDSVYVFRGGKRVAAQADRNELMTFGFDVYGQSPDSTAAHLAAKGFDLATVHEDTWQGRPAYVVGAKAPGDTASNQFWIDKERLVFVREIKTEQGQQGPARIEIEFNKYQPLGGGWIAPEVVIRLNGNEIMREEYSEMKADPSLPADLFTTTEYRRPAWVK
jgi:outer membrane lipoprotein-sorting protein